MTDKEENIIPDSYPLGADGPSQKDVDELKKKHGQVRACFIGGKQYVIRMMNRSEYTIFQTELNERMQAGDTSFDVDSEISNNDSEISDFDMYLDSLSINEDNYLFGNTTK